MTTMDVGGRVDLTAHGIRATGRVVRNPTTSLLYEHAVARGEARIAEGGPLVVDTGLHTGRSPKDKFVVREPGSEDRIWWDGNKPFSEDGFDRLREKVAAFLGREATLYVVDAFAGADPAHRIAVRVVTTHPYHALFAKTMFIDPTAAEAAEFEPQALVLHAPALEASPEADGTRTGTFVVLHPSRTEVLIGGTFYAGEIKKSIFTVMNDRLPLEGVFPMHCSANVDDGGHVAVFFGLSGTGKTTLSASPERALIGDDEHGWGDAGVFNFEGGCYAKVIRLSAAAEPEIYRTTHTFGTILENVVIDEYGVLDLDDDSKTENTRAAYKLEQIANAHPDKRAGHPSAVIMLTADAFGILPPIARLEPPAGAVLLPLRLHGEARRHRDRRDRAAADLLHLLRRAVPAAAAGDVRRDARAEARRARLDGVAGQHRLDRRPLRRGPAHADRGDARAAARGARRRPRPRRVPDGSGVRVRGAGGRARRGLVAARSALDLARSRGVRPQGAGAGGDVPGELRQVRRRLAGSRRGGAAGLTQSRAA